MNPPNTFGNNYKLNYPSTSRNINNNSNNNTSKYFTFKTSNVRLNNIPDINESMATGSTSKFTSNEKTENAASSSIAENFKSKLKKSDESGYRIFTGNAERIIRWNRVYDKFCYYEVISSVISIQQGNVRLQNIIMLKDKKGPILKIVYYINDHININDFYVGQTLRCVGRMIGSNTLHAVSIREATPSEMSNLQRLCYICDHTVTKIT